MIATELKQEESKLQLDLYEILKVVLTSHKRKPTQEKKEFINYQLDLIEYQKQKVTKTI